MSKRKEQVNESKKCRDAAWAKIGAHPIFAPLHYHARLVDRPGNLCSSDGWAVVTTNGFVHVHPTRRAEVEEWVYVFAHALLHLGLGHLQRRPHEREWNAACDCVAARFLADFKIGRPPEELRGELRVGQRDESALYREFCDVGIPDELRDWGTAGPGHADMAFAEKPINWRGFTDWGKIFSAGLTNAVDDAVREAGGHGKKTHASTPAEEARQWFINHYPLLGALAARFKIVSDNVICARLDISVAAIDEYMHTIYINPAAGLDPQELRFVMAHELLHVGLRHEARRQGREPYLWNVACDYVINGWLIEMGLGVLPRVGGLHDSELKGLGAEAVYDRIVTDIRRYRRLATLRSVGASDMIDSATPGWWESSDGMDVDTFCRRCLSQGLEYHRREDRGYLPLGLVEEIRALLQPPIGWDVQLARWFDHHFPSVEKRRSYARVSRRQSATPEIPRPRYVVGDNALEGRTFGVILDTSGSMNPETLAKALGAIASYSVSRDVPLARILFCDAVPYDAGYMAPDAIADRVQLKGRGGTVLQPAIDLLERAEDFPKDGPLLIITDGKCDRLRVPREHAFLMPQGAVLPFVPVGEVFHIV
ncbi:MAG TPA: peptidase [Phycisphaerae bacterium]|nr:peptidase [Phycisphaerae bacterium]